ncbi:MAG: 4Fe-4S binding protein [Synergistaceae bacterium]|nr:4Fe-4S binding protein [Synergistaceae bacterium]MBQ6982421.1 4Fe-4S binding protein [Synergistaceae bacterium]
MANSSPTYRGGNLLASYDRRKIIQLYSALLYNAHLRGFVSGEIYRGVTKFACVPGLNCYSCPAAIGACPLGALQNALGSANHRVGWYVLGIILLYGVILGRTVCGWLCPMGFIQELLHKIPTFKIAKSKFTRILSHLKYVLLAVLVVIMPLWYAVYHDMPMPGFCKYICPAGTFEGAIGLLSNSANSDMFGMLGVFFTSKFALMIILALACIFFYRAFCRFICPLGAIYGFFNRFNIVGVKVDENLCTNCGNCIRACKMDVRFVGDRECINCGECAKVCGQKAIAFRFGSSESPAKPRLIWGIALAVLCMALVGYNVLGSGAQRKFTASDAPAGYEVGQRLEDFSVKCLDGTDFHLADNLGKVVIINLWATYCTPCVKELPHFDALYREHKNDVVILAVHSSLVTDDPAEFVAKHDFTIKFAVDTDDDLVWNIVNGSSSMPQTVVLNRRGEVVYNQVGSVTAEVLDALYQKAGQ